MLGVVGADARRKCSSPVPSGRLAASSAMAMVASSTSDTSASMRASFEGKRR